MCPRGERLPQGQSFAPHCRIEPNLRSVAKNSRAGSSLREQRVTMKGERISSPVSHLFHSSALNCAPVMLGRALGTPVSQNCFSPHPSPFRANPPHKGGWRTHYTTLLPAFADKYRFSLFQSDNTTFQIHNKSVSDVKCAIVKPIERSLTRWLKGPGNGVLCALPAGKIYPIKTAEICTALIPPASRVLSPGDFQVI